MRLVNVSDVCARAVSRARTISTISHRDSRSRGVLLHRDNANRDVPSGRHKKVTKPRGQRLSGDIWILNMDRNSKEFWGKFQLSAGTIPSFQTVAKVKWRCCLPTPLWTRFTSKHYRNADNKLAWQSSRLQQDPSETCLWSNDSRCFTDGSPRLQVEPRVNGAVDTLQTHENV